MGKRDPPETGALRFFSQRNDRSIKTRVNHLGDARVFARDLRELGYGVTRWKNVTNRHMGEVVKAWQDRGLKTSTIKSRMSAVRSFCRVYGNDSLQGSNSAFGVACRVYVSNRDKSVPEYEYAQAPAMLSEGDGDALPPSGFSGVLVCG